MVYPKTLFARTGVTIAVAMLIFLLFSSSVIFYYILVPVARQAAGDLGALIVISAQTWVELPPATRPDFEDELYSNHGLALAPADTPLAPLAIKSPYMRFLEEALSARLGKEIPVTAEQGGDNWLWVDVPMADYTLRIGFSHEHIGARPPTAVLMLIVGASIVTLITSLLLVRRLNRPLARLAKATARFGRGEQPESLPEAGPEELALLARNFNLMTHQVQQLITNQTTLLVGISHDLRTPIARLQFAIELLHDEKETELLNGMRDDLKEMDHLIGRSLELARGKGDSTQEKKELDLVKLIKEIVADYQRRPLAIDWTDHSPCVQQTDPVALRRVLTNLLDNALRYGEDEPIAIHFECNDNGARISILDRGPGIPGDQLEAVFQPFYRLEHSRNLATGGSGLGLAIVRQLCDLHGWQIQLMPRKEGGTNACLELPNTAN